MKHHEVRQKYSAAHRKFNTLLSVLSGDETLRLILDQYYQKIGSRAVEKPHREGLTNYLRNLQFIF